MQEGSREKALTTIRNLKQKYESKASILQNANEAATRLLIIDEVLITLGWEKEDFNPEVNAAKAGYIDYLLSIENVPRLIVEAKRTGNTFGEPSRNSQRNTYQLRSFRSTFRAPFTHVLDQAEKYATETGVPYALITNGAEWILVQLLLSPGFSDLNDLRGYYFGNLFADEFNFELFWDLLSKSNIDNGSLEVNLGEINTKEADFSATPQTQFGQLFWQTIEFNQELREFYDLFFDEIIDPGRRNMLEKCFVTNTRLDQFDGELNRALKDTAPSFVSSATEITPDEGDRLVSHTGDQKGRVVLVTGSVGCGKSTFVTRALVKARHEQSDSLFALKIDLIDEIANDFQAVPHILWKYVTDEWKKTCPDSYHYETLKKIFGRELSELKKGPFQAVFKSDKRELAQQEAKLLDANTTDPENFFKNCWRYYRERGKGTAIFLDNVDRASEAYQQQVYNFAHKVARETGATVIITMREFTFFRGREAGFLDVRSDDIVFHLQSPNLEQLISKRINYIEEHIQEDHRLPQWKRTKDWDKFYKNILSYSSSLKSVLLVQNNGRKILALMSSVAWHDVRTFLNTLRQIHFMLGGSESYWSISEVIAALITPNNNGVPVIGNLFRPSYPAYQCYFLKLRTLLLMQYGQQQYETRRGTKLAVIIRFLKQYGYQQRWIKKAIEELVQERFLECLEAPAEEDYTKNYALSETHSFRPSPLAIESINEIILNPIYLALVGNDLPFHNEYSFRKYEEVFSEFHEAFMRQGLSRIAIELLADTEASRIVASYLFAMLKDERPSDSLAKYKPEVAATEGRIKAIEQVLIRYADLTNLPTSTPRQRSLFDLIPSTSDFVQESSRLPIPKTLGNAKIGRSELGPMVFWALIHLRINGKYLATGTEIAEVINSYLVSDYNQKAPNNVSRTLRSDLLKSQQWLIMKKISARQVGFSVKDTWPEHWAHIFGESPPEVDF